MTNVRGDSWWDIGAGYHKHLAEATNYTCIRRANIVIYYIETVKQMLE
jgi:hypothetical protein